MDSYWRVRDVSFPAASPCAPVELEVVRERPVDLPGATLSSYAPLVLQGVPTCRDGAPTLALADPLVSTFVGAVVPGGPAAKAGLSRGDAIAAANGKPVRSFREVNAILGASVKVGEPVARAIADGRRLAVVPEAQSQVDEMTGETRPRPFLGFEPDQRGLVLGSSLLAEQVTVRMGFLEVAGNAVGNLGEVIRLTALGIARIAHGTISFKTVDGPIRLFRIAAQAGEEGLATFLFKMALISVNLGLMNLLPIPVLDGGHLAACLVEGVTRRPLFTIRQAGRVRLELSDGDWIDVKRELTVGEARELLFGTMIEQPDGTFKRDIDQTQMARLLAYLVDWSFQDENGEGQIHKVPVSADAINALDVQTLAELLGALNVHEEATRTNNGPRATVTG